MYLATHTFNLSLFTTHHPLASSLAHTLTFPSPTPTTFCHPFPLSFTPAEGLKTPMITEKHLTFPEVNVSLPSTQPSCSSSTRGSLDILNDNSHLNTSLIPPTGTVSSSPSFESLQTWEGGSDSDESIESEKRDRVSKLSDSYNTNSLKRRRNQFQKQDSGMFSSGSLEEAGVDTAVAKMRAGRRRSDPNDYGNEKLMRHMKNVDRSGSTGEDSLRTPTRRDKTTGLLHVDTLQMYRHCAIKLYIVHVCVNIYLSCAHAQGRVVHLSIVCCLSVST